MFSFYNGVTVTGLSNDQIAFESSRIIFLELKCAFEIVSPKDFTVRFNLT